MQAKKSLGQNFLKNEGILKKIREKTEEILKKEQKNYKKAIKILEIGPGKGALTKHLLETNCVVQAIEADDRLIPLLQEEFKKPLENKVFDLLHQDIREFDPKSIKDPYILVANIPYYLTGFIFRQFLESDNQPLAIIVLIQKEVAKRIVDTKQTLLSLSVQVYGKPSILTHVSKGNFNPAPKVDSSVLVIEDINKKQFKGEHEEKRFWALAKKAFGSKRKQLGGTIFKQMQEKDKEKLSLYTKKRPEELSVSDWLIITSCYDIDNA